MRVDVRVMPRASRTAVELRDGRLVVRVTAPPVGGAANDAVREALARALHVPRSAVRVVTGEKGRNKSLEIGGVDEAELRRRIAALGTAG